jgi:hypothetical protein
MQKESWRPVVGLEKTHLVSDLGRVQSITRVVRNSAKGVRTVRGRILKPYAHTGGYVAILLSVQMVRTHHYVHRMVCEAWHGPGPDGCEVLHRDGNKKNNTPDNLRWGTRFENLADNAIHGIKPIGESHGMAKLTEEKVLRIRADSRMSGEIAKDYGVCSETIANIKSRKNWKHI